MLDDTAKRRQMEAFEAMAGRCREPSAPATPEAPSKLRAVKTRWAGEGKGLT